MKRIFVLLFFCLTACGSAPILTLEEELAQVEVVAPGTRTEMCFEKLPPL